VKDTAMQGVKGVATAGAEEAITNIASSEKNA